MCKTRHQQHKIKQHTAEGLPSYHITLCVMCVCLLCVCTTKFGRRRRRAGGRPLQNDFAECECVCIYMCGFLLSHSNLFPDRSLARFAVDCVDGASHFAILIDHHTPHTTPRPPTNFAVTRARCRLLLLLRHCHRRRRCCFAYSANSGSPR